MNKWVFMVLFVVFGAGIVAGTGQVLNQLNIYQYPENVQNVGTLAGPNGTTEANVHVTLATFPDSPFNHPQWEQEHNFFLCNYRNCAIPIVDSEHLDWVTYGPTTTITVPAHSLVTMTIYQYDSGESLLNDFYTYVRGTVDDTMTVNGNTVGHIPPNTVAHTFTIHGIPSASQPWLFVNIPLPAVPDPIVEEGADNGYPAHPNVITFSFHVGDPGHYVWQCEYPCGTQFDNFGGPMSVNGYMNGTFDVV